MTLLRCVASALVGMRHEHGFCSGRPLSRLEAPQRRRRRERRRRERQERGKASDLLISESLLCSLPLIFVASPGLLLLSHQPRPTSFSRRLVLLHREMSDTFLAKSLLIASERRTVIRPSSGGSFSKAVGGRDSVVCAVCTYGDSDGLRRAADV